MLQNFSEVKRPRRWFYRLVYVGKCHKSIVIEKEIQVGEILQKGALTLLLTKRILLPSPVHPPSVFRKMSRKASRSMSRRGVGVTLNTTNQ
jgi:hypothetical protein